MKALIGELRRRNVIQVGIAYLVVGWAMAQIVATFFPSLQLPAWTITFAHVLILLGFPLAIIVAWAFERTPDGIKRTVAAPATEALAAPDGKSVAVLPLANMSANPDDAYFASGIHDDLLTQLAKIKALKVISRTSVMEYKDTKKNMRQIGEELGVATILEGGVQRAGEAVRINVQLIRAATDEHMWAETYDRELTARNIFEIQSEMANAIAKALQATLSPEEVARLDRVPTENTRAYDYYLNAGEISRSIVDFDSMYSALELYERAAAEDPGFALAYIGMSNIHAQLYAVGIDRTWTRLDKLRETVDRAFKMAPDLPEAHLARANYLWNTRDFEEALAELQRAEAGIPGDPMVYMLRGYVLPQMGRWDEALTAFRRACELDPRASNCRVNQGLVHLLQRQYADAEERFNRSLEIAPIGGMTKYLRSLVPLFRDGDVSEINDVVRESASEIGRAIDQLLKYAALYERDYTGHLRNLETGRAGDYIGGHYYEIKELQMGRFSRLAGDEEASRVHYQAARKRLEADLDETNPDPDHARIATALAEALCGVGEREAGLAMARKSLEMLPTKLDARNGPENQMLVTMNVLVPERAYDEALKELDAYFSGPGYWSIEGILPDPRLDEFKTDGRFLALVEKYRRK